MGSIQKPIVEYLINRQKLNLTMVVQLFIYLRNVKKLSSKFRDIEY
jgi:hypothetical protein